MSAKFLVTTSIVTPGLSVENCLPISFTAGARDPSTQTTSFALWAAGVDGALLGAGLLTVPVGVPVLQAARGAASARPTKLRRFMRCSSEGPHRLVRTGGRTVTGPRRTLLPPGAQREGQHEIDIKDSPSVDRDRLLTWSSPDDHVAFADPGLVPSQMINVWCGTSTSVPGKDFSSSRRGHSCCLASPPRLLEE
ncbi:hypothetical protein GCM10028864_27630 [Microlunatus parietis]